MELGPPSGLLPSEGRLPPAANRSSRSCLLSTVQLHALLSAEACSCGTGQKLSQWLPRPYFSQNGNVRAVLDSQATVVHVFLLYRLVCSGSGGVR